MGDMLTCCSEVPRNCICIDTAVLERQLFVTGLRGPMSDQSGKPRPKGTTLSLEKVVQSFGYSVPCTLHNAGNDAFVCLWALQMLLDGPDKLKAPIPRMPASFAMPFTLRPPIIKSHTTSSLVRLRSDARSMSFPGVGNKVARDTSALDLDEHGVLHSGKTYAAPSNLSKR
jgi:hypothetical protein